MTEFSYFEVFLQVVLVERPLIGKPKLMKFG